jgi:hypothetical protein
MSKSKSRKKQTSKPNRRAGVRQPEGRRSSVAEAKPKRGEAPPWAWLHDLGWNESTKASERRAAYEKDERASWNEWPYRAVVIDPISMLGEALVDATRADTKRAAYFDQLLRTVDANAAVRAVSTAIRRALKNPRNEHDDVAWEIDFWLAPGWGAARRNGLKISDEARATLDACRALLHVAEAKAAASVWAFNQLADDERGTRPERMAPVERINWALGRIDETFDAAGVDDWFLDFSKGPFVPCWAFPSIATAVAEQYPRMAGFRGLPLMHRTGRYEDVLADLRVALQRYCFIIVRETCIELQGRREHVDELRSVFEFTEHQSAERFRRAYRDARALLLGKEENRERRVAEPPSAEVHSRLRIEIDGSQDPPVIRVNGKRIYLGAEPARTFKQLWDARGEPVRLRDDKTSARSALGHLRGDLKKKALELLPLICTRRGSGPYMDFDQIADSTTHMT